MTRAFVFPGQGSQAVGMGRELAEAYEVARRTFEEVDDALDQHLSRMIFEGPEGDLTLTENAQPALMAVSVAVTRVLVSEGRLDIGRYAAFVAGHSLGEYSALCAAGSFELADVARLLRLRGQAMQRAVPPGRGAMAALIGADFEMARDIAASAASATEVCSAANDNAPGQVVISGDTAAIDRAVQIAGERGLKRTVRLSVSAPFHCAMMRPAAEEMAEALAGVSIKTPAVPVVANVTSQPVTAPEDIRRLLVEQITGVVRWRESVLNMKAQGVDTLIEVGAGKVLAGLAKRIDKELSATSIHTPDDVESFLKSL